MLLTEQSDTFIFMHFHCIQGSHLYICSHLYFISTLLVRMSVDMYACIRVLPIYLVILSLHDIVSSRSPCRTPSHVCMVLLERTGMVPSPDSILVLSWPLAFLFGCLSPWSEENRKNRWIRHLKRMGGSYRQCF